MKEGMLYEMQNKKKKKAYYCFLFNDCIIQTRIHSYDKKTHLRQYKYVKRFNLVNATVADVPAATADGKSPFLWLPVLQD